MTKNQAVLLATKAANGKRPIEIIDLNSDYYILGFNDYCYAVNKHTKAVSDYNPLSDYANFHKALLSGKHELV